MSKAKQHLVVCVGPNLPREAKATFHVHAVGCADLTRGWIARYAADERPMKVSSRRDLCDTIYPPSDFEVESGEYMHSEFHYAPCCGLPDEDEELYTVWFNADSATDLMQGADHMGAHTLAESLEVIARLHKTGQYSGLWSICDEDHKDIGHFDTTRPDSPAGQF